MKTTHRINRRWLKPAIQLAVIVAVGTQLGSSCSTTDGSRYPDRNDRYPDRYDDRYPGRYDEHDDYNYRDRVPEDARLIIEGRGDLSFRAASSGRAWLYDERDRRVIYYVDLLDGDDFRMSPDEDKIWINGRTAQKMSIAGDRDHRIYFDGRRAYVDRRTQQRDDNHDRDRDRDRDSSRTNPSPNRLVPDSAKMVAEGKDTDLSFKAPNDGRIYFFDNNNNVLVQTFSIRKGQRFTVSISKDIATIDGKTVLNRKGLSRRTTYRLLFDD